MHGKNGKSGMLIKGIYFSAMAIIFVLALGTIVMYLWNWLLPEITGVKKISFWQAVGLFVLARILFGGFRWGNRGHRKNWKKKRERIWQRKMETMDDDKKERLKKKWESHFGKSEE